MLDSYLCMQEDLEKDNGHSLVLVLRRSGTLSKKTVLKENGTKWRKGCCWNSQRADVQFSVLRPHCPEVILKSKGRCELSIHYAADQETIETIFRKLFLQISSVFTEQSQRYVKSMNPFTRERSDLLWWDNQVPHSCSVRSRQKFLRIVMTKRIKIFCCNNMENELRSCHNKTKWGFFVWMHDFWMLLKLDNTSGRKTLQISHNLIEWHVVNTLFQEKKKHHHRKAGSKETPKLGPYWKLQPVIFTVNTELRSEFGLWTDNTHSWVRISHGSNKFVMKLNNFETEIPEDQLEEYALKLSAKDFACRSKAKAKPQRREPAGSSPRIVPIERRNWIDIEPGKYFFSEYEVSKKVTFLLRHSQQMHREEDGAIHLWRIKKIFRIHSHNLFIGLTIVGKQVWQQEED